MIKNCEVCTSAFTDNTYNKNKKYCSLKCQWASPVARATARRNESLYRKRRPVKHLLKRAKRRASQKNLEFSLIESDIIIPEFCPVLGIKLDSPSLDRVNNSLGYTKENVRVISTRANTLKRDATREELIKIVNYMSNSS